MVSDLKTFPYKECKISPQNQKFSFSANFALLAGFFLVLVLLSALVERCFVSRMRDFFGQIGWLVVGLRVCYQWNLPRLTTSFNENDVTKIVQKICFKGPWCVSKLHTFSNHEPFILALF